jgi:hypothetical protein
MQTKRIETYSLFEFCQQVEQSVIEGWRFDFNSNEMFPTAFGSMLVTGMVKTEVTEVTAQIYPAFAAASASGVVEVSDNVINDIIEEVQQVKRGRKPKDSI